jgi:hypothetical protein
LQVGTPLSLSNKISLSLSLHVHVYFLQRSVYEPKTKKDL